MNHSPKISIIIPTYNSEALIKKSLQSILIQTYTKYEVLVIDGKSTDKTIDVVTEIAKNHKQVTYISEKDKGVYDAMNKGIELAKGDWLYFLGSDDTLRDKNVLQKVIAVLEQKNCDVLYGNVIKSGNNSIYAGEFTYRMLNERNICHQAIFVNKSVFNRIGNFNLKYKVLADWVHNFRWFFNPEIKHKYTDLVIANYSDGGFSATSQDVPFRKDKFGLFFFGARAILSKSDFLILCKDEFYRAKSQKLYIRVVMILFFYYYTYLFD